MMQDILQFDSFGRILVVASISSLIVLYPPCLANKTQLYRMAESYTFHQSFEMRLLSSKIPDGKISKLFMFRVCENFYQRGFLDVASSFTSSRVAIVFSLQNEICIFLLSTFDDVFFEHLKEWEKGKIQIAIFYIATVINDVFLDKHDIEEQAVVSLIRN